MRNGKEEPVEKQRDFLHLRRIYAAIGVVGMLFLGIIYSWSIVKTPFVNSFGWSFSELTMAYTLSQCFYCIGCIAGAQLGKKFTPRFMLMVSGALVCTGFVFVSKMQGGIANLYIFYSVCAGFGIGVGYNCLVSLLSKWFPEKQGTISGLLMMGFGLSTMLFGKIFVRCYGISDDAWRPTLAVFGVVSLTVLLICSLILKNPEGNVCLPKPIPLKGQKNEGREYSFQETMRQSSYWQFYVYGALTAATGSTVISFSGDLAQYMGASLSVAATLTGVLSVFNGLGRVISGIVFDKIGSKRVMFLVSVLAGMSSLVMLTALYTESILVMVMGLCMAGMSYGCCPTISSAFVAQRYGRKDFAMNYAVGNTKIFLASMVASIASAILENGGSYVHAFILLLAMSVIAFAFSMMINREKSKYS